MKELRLCSYATSAFPELRQLKDTTGDPPERRTLSLRDQITLGIWPANSTNDEASSSMHKANSPLQSDQHIVEKHLSVTVTSTELCVLTTQLSKPFPMLS